MAITNLVCLNQNDKIANARQFMGTGVPASTDTIVTDIIKCPLGSEYFDRSSGKTYRRTAEAGVTGDFIPATSGSTPGAIPVLAGLTVLEYGDNLNRKTVLVLDEVAVGNPAGAANLGFGKLVYTLPAGAAIIKASKINLSLQGGGVVDADTPDVGLGTVIASGAVAVLSGTATFENILTGQTFPDCDGTAVVKTAKATSSPFELIVETADAHTIHLNIADGWAGADALTASGTITIEWSLVG